MPGYFYDFPRPRTWRADFNVGCLADKNYCNKRLPLKNPLDLASRPGFARTDVDVTFSTELSIFGPDSKLLFRQEAGASIHLNDYFDNDIGITISNVTNHKAIILRVSEEFVPIAFSHISCGVIAAYTATTCVNTTVIPSGTSSGPSSYTQNVTLIEDPAVAAGLPVTFFNEAKETQYRLGYAVNGSLPKYARQVSNRWLGIAISLNFAGSRFAVYNAGSGHASLATAGFDYM